MKHTSSTYFCLVLIMTATLFLSGCGGNSETPVETQNKLQSELQSPPAAALPAVAPTIFAGARNNYTVTRTSTGFAVKSIANGSITNLTNQTSIKFDDVTVNLLVGDNSKTISASSLNTLIELYIAFFNRVPDADGMNYWIDAIKNGMTTDGLVANFYAAAIYFSSVTGYSATMTNEEFVLEIYKNVLGRSASTTPPDPDGVKYWTNKLLSGTSKGTLVSYMLNSAHTFAGDVKLGWVPQLLDNKVAVGKYFSIQQGLNYITSEESISKGILIAKAVTPTDITVAKQKIGMNDNAFDLTLTTTETPATLLSITINSTSNVLAVGSKQIYFAVGAYSNGTTKVIDNAVWNSSDTSKVVISSTGEATGLAVGVSGIKATLSGISSNTATVTVSNPTQINPTQTKLAQVPWVLVSASTGGFVNNNTVMDFRTGGVSDDGNVITFSSWSDHGFGLAKRNCSFDWIYVRNISKASLSIGATNFNGTPYCGYESYPTVSGDGSVLIYRGQQLPYTHSTNKRDGIWRADIGYPGYSPVSVKGLDFSLEQGGSLKIGEILIGQSLGAMADTNGNSIVFTMKYIENSSDVPRQYNSTIFANAVKRLDKGAQPAGNQDYKLSHTDANYNDLNFDISGAGGIMYYSEFSNGAIRYKTWDMLARVDSGDLFYNEKLKQPTVSPNVCGISNDGRYILVKHKFDVPLNPRSPSDAHKNFVSYGRLSRYDRVTKEFLFVGVAEEESVAKQADCEGSLWGSRKRQLSKDGNRVVWRATGEYFFVRDIGNGRTLKIKAPSTIYSWAFSGDGQYIVFVSDKAPDGTVYKSPTGNTLQQIYRYGPITSGDFGAAFSLEAFEAKLISH